jgi:hypothetical protein
MALQFKKYESEVENLGTIAELSASFGLSSDKNLKSDKRVTLVLQDEEGASTIVVCSIDVSNHIRKSFQAGKPESWVMSSIRNLSLLADKNGTVWVSPLGDPSMRKASYSIDELESINASFEELMNSYEKLVV